MDTNDLKPLAPDEPITVETLARALAQLMAGLPDPAKTTVRPGELAVTSGMLYLTQE